MISKKNPYAELLGVEILEAGNGSAHVKTKVLEEHSNHHGFIHGGFLYSIADVAFELASNSQGAEAVGITTSMQFHRPVKAGATLEAFARETHLGKSLATYQIEIVSDEKIIATFTGTVFRKIE